MDSRLTVSSAALNSYPESVKNIIESIDNVLINIVDISALPVEYIKIVASDVGCRAFYNQKDSIIMAAGSSCFHPNYRGYRYKTFGGIKDLTPAGIFCHELGHAVEWCSDTIHNKFESISSEKRVTVYAYTNTSEDIAESVRLYLSNNKLCLERIPYRYEILRLIDNDIKFSKHY